MDGYGRKCIAIPKATPLVHALKVDQDSHATADQLALARGLPENVQMAALEGIRGQVGPALLGGVASGDR